MKWLLRLLSGEKNARYLVASDFANVEGRYISSRYWFERSARRVAARMNDLENRTGSLSGPTEWYVIYDMFDKLETTSEELESKRAAKRQFPTTPFPTKLSQIEVRAHAD